jgi:hypothetical protein
MWRGNDTTGQIEGIVVMVILTTMGRIRDWSSLRELHLASLALQARAAGASSLQIYRDVSDASRILIVAVFRDQEAACELFSLVDEGVGALIESSEPICQVWEAIEFGELG